MICHHCKGSGTMGLMHQNICSTCGGSGKIIYKKDKDGKIKLYQKLLKDTTAQDLIEYMLLTGFLGITIYMGMTIYDNTAKDNYERVNKVIQEVWYK